MFLSHEQMKGNINVNVKEFKCFGTIQIEKMFLIIFRTVFPLSMPSLNTYLTCAEVVLPFVLYSWEISQIHWHKYVRCVKSQFLS
jgi:hypothetical protein